MSYQEIGLSITPNQKKKVAREYKKGLPVSIQLKPDQLSGSDKMLLTETQIKQIEKAKKAGKGLRLSLSKTQLEENMKSGGFLQFLLGLLPSLATGAASALGSFGMNKILGKGVQSHRIKPKGKGLFLHGTQGEGVFLPGTQGGIIDGNMVRGVGGKGCSCQKKI